MKTLILLLWAATVSGAAAQTAAPAATPARELIEDGVKLYDAGKYDEAVAKYQQALATEPNNEIAGSELALAFNTLGRNAEAVALCEKLLQANSAADVLVYVTYGNSLDAQKKTKKALQAYEQGLKYHPNSYSLYFNRGVAQATTGQTPASISSFQQAVALNPQHATSHMSLGVMQTSAQARIPAVLALARFLVLEPRSKRAAQRLPLLDEAMMRGVTRTGEKAVTIQLSAEALKGANGKSNGPDNFGPAEMLLSVSGALALDEKHRDDTPAERFSAQFASLCRGLGELSGKQKGFTWEYYVPYFAELEKKGYVPALTYLVHASQTEVPAVQQWLAAHSTEVQVFQEWSKNYVWPKPAR